MNETFVLDLDGTLLQPEGILLDTDCSYLKMIQKEGYNLIIATGRSYVEAKSIIQQLEIEKHSSGLVLADGQYVIDYGTSIRWTGEYLNHPKDTTKIMNLFGSNKKISVRLFTECGDYYYFSSAISYKYCKQRAANILRKNGCTADLLLPCRQVIMDNVLKITVDTDGSITDLLRLKDLYEVSFVHDKKRFEIKKKGVNKANGVVKILQERKIDFDDVFVFGNDENDICLFERFKHNYVVDTAPDNIKKMASSVLRSDSSKYGVVVKKIKEIIEVGKENNVEKR